LDRRKLTLGIVNPTLESRTIPVRIEGARLKGTGTRWQIAGTDPQAYNDPDEPPRVKVEQLPLDGALDRVTVPPCRVTLLVLDAE